MSSNSSTSRLRATLLLLLAFAAGLVAGVAGDRFTLLRQHRLMPRSGARFVTSRITARLDRELHLTPQQKNDVTAILDRHRGRVEALWSGVRPAVRNEIMKSNAEIEAILDPPQKEKFRKLSERWRRQAGRFTR